MNTIELLRESYGYGVPIFLKDIRLGGKSKTAIRKELSRAVEKGIIERDNNGVFYFSDNIYGIKKTLSFEKVIERRFIKNDYGITGFDLDVYGYYSGQTFLNIIGISQQVPAVLEITTNRTTCKRKYKYKNYKVVLRKPILKINHANWKILQFFEMFSYLSDEEVHKNHELIKKYINENFDKKDFYLYVGYFSARVFNLLNKEKLMNAFRLSKSNH